MPRYKLTIEYDGTGYHGWQKQDGLASVQQALEEAIAQFTRHTVSVFAAGRTDTGVHALGQVVHVDLEKEWPDWKVQEASNGILQLNGHAVSVVACEPVPDTFDARFSATKRHYRYRLINRKGPLTVDHNRAWWVRRPLDETAMHDAAQELVGHHDFTTFRSTECQAKSPVRTLDELNVNRVSETELEIIAISRAFLHNQVRSMVGSLKLVGESKWTAMDLANARDLLDRKACGPVAPSCGLYLVKVDY